MHVSIFKASVAADRGRFVLIYRESLCWSLSGAVARRPFATPCTLLRTYTKTTTKSSGQTLPGRVMSYHASQACFHRLFVRQP